MAIYNSIATHGRAVNLRGKCLGLVAVLLFALTGCAVIDEAFGPRDTRTDLVTVRITVGQVSAKRVAAECPDHANVVACAVSGRTDMIYIQGDGPTTTMLLKVQFMTWADIGDKCGRLTAPACWDNNTLFTYPYTTADPYIIGTIGDIVAEQMGLDIGLNRRAQLGHEVMVHALGVGKDPRYGEGSKHILSTYF